MRILITGASGLLGLNLALEIANQHTVFGQVNNHPIKEETFSVLKANLLEPGTMEWLLEKSEPDWVIHCAALADLDRCERNPSLARELNTVIPKKLAELCRNGGARLLHVSTDAVFDGVTGSYSEQDLPNPLSTYAKTKLEAEHEVAEENPDAIIARVNLFGWSLRGKRSLAEFFFNNLAQGNSIMGFVDVFFCPLLANDIAQLFTSMLANRLRGIYHVVSEDSISKYSFGVSIAERFGFNKSLIKPTSFLKAGFEAARSPNLTLQIDKLSRDLAALIPTVSTGIDHFYSLYQQGYPHRIQQLAVEKL